MIKAIGQHIGEVARAIFALGLAMASIVPMQAQQSETAAPASGTVTVSTKTMERLERHLAELESEVAELKAQVREIQSATPPVTLASTGSIVGLSHSTVDGQAEDAVLSSGTQTPSSEVLSADDRRVLNYLKGTTINVSIDGYYAYNFNDPIGRVNLLRAYDVSSNAFSLNEAAVIFERAPDIDGG